MEGRVAKPTKVWLCALVAAVMSCVGASTPAADKGMQADVFIKRFQTTHRGLDPLLVVTPISDNTNTVLTTFVQEVSEEFDVSVLATSPETKVSDLAAQLHATKPACIVLMNNPSVALYRKYQAQYPSDTFPAAVVVMASFLEQIHRGLHNTTGISYEMPGVTIVAKLRTLFEQPIRRVGVIYRKDLQPFLLRQIKLAKPERIEFVGYQVANEPTAREIRRAVSHLREDRSVEALWILNDNALLGDKDVLSGGWMRALENFNVPVIVGVSSLVNPKVHFGSFAMLPDHAALGTQAADMVFELRDDEWDAKSRAIEDPLSIKTVVDLSLAKEYAGFKTSAIGSVDRVLE
jgi:hypothetical protein